VKKIQRFPQKKESKRKKKEKFADEEPLTSLISAATKVK